MEIRTAQIEDLETLKSIEQAIIHYERPFGHNLDDDPISYYDLANLIEREDAEVVVATKEGEIIGSGYILIKDSKSYIKYKKHGYLGFMFVSPKHRGQGVNGKVVDALVAWGKKRNITEFQLEVYAENESAVKAYEKRNFIPDLLRMRFNTEDK